MKELLRGASQYKVNMHAHSCISDGKLTPVEIKEAYLREGYHAVVFSDHEVFIPHNDLTDEHFVALNAYEYAVAEKGEGHRRRYYHMNLIARHPDLSAQVLFCPQNVLGNARAHIPNVRYYGQYVQTEYAPSFVNRLVSEAHEAGFLVQYNHPLRSLHTACDYAALTGIDLLEVFNFNSTVDCLPERDDRVLGDFLSFGHFVTPTGGDDNHNSVPFGGEGCDSFGAYTMVAAESLTYENLTDALAKGNAYATEGPRIYSLTVDETGVVNVLLSDLPTVTVRGDGRGIFKVRTQPKSNGVCAAAFKLPPEWIYFRLSMEDTMGRRAYTRAYLSTELS